MEVGYIYSDESSHYTRGMPSLFPKSLFYLLGLQHELRNGIFWYRDDAHTSGQLLSQRDYSLKTQLTQDIGTTYTE